MTNIMLEGGKEIDLLAINPVSGEKYHIEVRVAIGRGFRLRMIDSRTKDGRKHRRGMDTLSEIKFDPPVVVETVTRVFGSSDYKKSLVVWEVEDESVVGHARNQYGIDIWKMRDILNELIREIGTKGFRDDVLRTIQLISMRQNPLLALHI